MTVDPGLLQDALNYSFPEACKKLGIGSTALKRICRERGIARWPYGGKKKGKGTTRQRAMDRKVLLQQAQSDLAQSRLQQQKSLTNTSDQGPALPVSLPVHQNEATSGAARQSQQSQKTLRNLAAEARRAFTNPAESGGHGQADNLAARLLRFYDTQPQAPAGRQQVAARGDNRRGSPPGRPMAPQ